MVIIDEKVLLCGFFHWHMHVPVPQAHPDTACTGQDGTCRLCAPALVACLAHRFPCITCVLSSRWLSHSTEKEALDHEAVLLYSPRTCSATPVISHFWPGIATPAAPCHDSNPFPLMCFGMVARPNNLALTV